MNHDQPNPFYVGYLPLPRAHKRFLLGFITICVISSLALSFGIAIAQRDPGATQVFSSTGSTWVGTIYESPYPMLVDDGGEIHLLIGLGKYGEHDRIKPWIGKRCEVSGYALAREHRRAIQLDVHDSTIAQAQGPTHSLPNPIQIDDEPIEFVGEIVDGKCYLGAMKPGDGKAHKACATLCILGRLPPMFVDEHIQENDMLPLVLVDGSTDLPKSSLELVGERVRFVGKRSSIGSLTLINIDSKDIQRVND